MSSLHPGLTAEHTPLPWLRKAGWGLGSLGSTALIYIQTLFVLYFFTAILGLPPGISGTAILIAKVSDILAGLLIGRMSDRMRSRLGRRRPFMTAGAAVSAAGVLLVFNPPIVQAWFQCASIMLMGLGYCLFTVPYLAMPSEVTRSADERVQMMSWRVTFVSTAELMSKSLLPLIVAAFASPRAGYAMLSIAAAAIIGFSMLASMLLSPAEPAPPPAAPTAAGADWRAVLANRPFILLMATKVPQAFGLYVSLTTLLFFFTGVLGGTAKLVALWGLCSNLASIAAIPFWFWASRRISKRRIFTIGVLGYAAVAFSWLLAREGDPTWMIAARAAISGPFTAGLLISSQSMLPEAIAWSNSVTGASRDGIYAAAYSLVEKTCGALAPFAVGWSLQLVGLSGHAAQHGGVVGEARTALYMMVAVTPGVAYMLGLAPMAFYALKPWSGKTDVAPQPAS